jgi:hypothetical protein
MVSRFHLRSIFCIKLKIRFRFVKIKWISCH